MRAKYPGPANAAASLASIALLALPGCDRGTPRAPAAHTATATVARADAGNAAARGASDPDEIRALSSAVAQALAGLFRETGDAAAVDGATLRAAGHVVTARAEVAEAREQPDHTVAALEVWLDLDGVPQPAFHVVAVGIDANRAEAAAHAVREWTVQYGMPTVDALGSLGHAGAGAAGSDAGAAMRERHEPVPVGPYRAFPGPMGVRGETPEGWDAGAMRAELLRRLGAAAPGEVLPAPGTAGPGEVLPAPGTAGPAFHAVHVTAHVRGSQVGEANCRVDGNASERLCRLVRELPWPAGEGDYIVRQYVVFAPAPAG